MENPFKPDMIVYDKDLIGRDEELKDLEFRLSSSRSVRIVMTAPRRFGKTSLLHNVIRKLRKKNHFCVYIDIFNCLSIDGFANILVEGIVQAPGYSTLKKITSWATENLFSIRSSMKFTSDLQGNISVEPIIFQNKDSAIKKIRDAFKDLAAISKKQPVLLVIDEFQSMVDWDKNRELEHTLRSIMQELQGVNIIFSGSQVRLLKDIFESPNRPFFNQARNYSLSRIDKDVFKEWILKSFQDSKLKVEEIVIDKIIEFSHNNPQGIQMICYELWNRAKTQGIKQINMEHLGYELRSLVGRKNTDYENTWLLLSNSQKVFLKALAKEHETKSPQGKDFCNRYNLSPSTVQVMLPKLELKFLVTHEGDTYYITDPLFQLWMEAKAA